MTSISTESRRHSDQAESLRAMVLERSRNELLDLEAPPVVKARSIAITSGKGGVGGSNLALNLAIALGELGRRVVLVDADLGVANIDLLCGLTAAVDLGDVLSGSVTLAEALAEGPGGIKIIPGMHGMRGLPDVLGDGPARLAAELAVLESEADYILIDAGSGLGSAIAAIGSAVEEAIVVTTPEPTSIADAQAALHRLRRLPGLSLRLIVNQAMSTAEGLDTLDRLTSGSREFFNTVVMPLGFVRSDPKVARAVRERRPFLAAFPKTRASRDVRKIAEAMISETESQACEKPGFFANLAARWTLSRLPR